MHLSRLPCIEFCKHIASTELFFGVGKVGPTSQPSLIAPASLNTENGNTTYDVNSAVSLISVTNKIITLSQELLMHTPKPKDVSNTVKLLHSVSKHLAAVVALGTGDGPLLPEKEWITPNQHSWTETAQQMGVKRIKKRRGKVDSALTAEHIGEINCKCTRANKDPYGAGEQSGNMTTPVLASETAYITAFTHFPLSGPTPLSLRSVEPRQPRRALALSHALCTHLALYSTLTLCTAAPSVHVLPHFLDLSAFLPLIRPAPHWRCIQRFSHF
jgi:hypothetical protein